MITLQVHLNIESVIKYTIYQDYCQASSQNHYIVKDDIKQFNIKLDLCISYWNAIYMCSLAVSTLDSPAVGPRSNPGSSKILMSENHRLYTTSPVVMC